MDFLNTAEKRDRRMVHLPMGRFGEAVEVAKGALFRTSSPLPLSLFLSFSLSFAPRNLPRHRAIAPWPFSRLRLLPSPAPRPPSHRGARGGGRREARAMQRCNSVPSAISDGR